MTGSLTFDERYRCRNILMMLPRDNILSLHHTVTKKNKGWIGTTEAIDDIISHSKNAEELLKRKKVQRDVLFTYLQNDHIGLPKATDKQQLVNLALGNRSMNLYSPPPMFSTLSSLLTSPVLPTLFTPISTPPSNPAPSYQNYYTGSSLLTSPVLPTAITPISTPPYNPAPSYQASVKPESALVFEQSSQLSKVNDDSSGTDLSVMAQEFCKWFYELLNDLNPFLGQTAQDLYPLHFWEDVKLRIVSKTGSEEYDGAELVSLRLLALARDERLLLSPNLEPHGLRALSSPHGLVLVAVAGTIHRDRTCLGIYEQVFGLIRSPLDNNQWKIKFTEVRMQKKDDMSVGDELAPPPLTWDPSELERLCGSP
ncbi:uncharacterized protein C3orf38 homolog isoform X2 [Hypomesus transpacificus]|uniref:uncharacterized protein C3orf38 homolog isoform X2 n=1 Tax=Hypomesus transpacificus TaxID=137520 RepID=UPI001F07909C|nr:uncharacterized protein C3orf38 homolog isoform X2 [Hypomesus transpacificus]